MKRPKLGAAALPVLAVLVGSPATAAADSLSRITQGDAAAVLEASFSGGWAVLLHSEKVYGPAQGGPTAAGIRPLPGTPFDGAHYCVLDWHTILLTWFEGGDSTFKRADAEELISAFDVSFALDGVQLAGIIETPVVAFLNPERFGLDVAYGANWGRIMAPSDLDVGSHVLRWTGVSPDYGTIVLQITFYVDAAGTGACL